MKLSEIKKSFIPIAISGITMNSNPGIHTFLYDQHDVAVEDSFISRYVENTSSNNYTQLLSKIQFNDYYKKWEREIRFASSPDEIVNNDNFIKICNLGESAIVFIAEKLKERPSYLVWAYNKIFGFKISDAPNTTISEASRLWLKHLKRQNIIE